jgi:hypothetical protein
MAKRKPVPSNVQQQIFLSSRRRCCLCFWLDQIDEVVKGQIAHLDDDPSNNDPSNLAFLCLRHHDEYDGKTSVSKGLQRGEVATWRDELYKEMEYRFRTVRAAMLEFAILGFKQVPGTNKFYVRFCVKNVGDVAVRDVRVSIRMHGTMTAERPKPKRNPIDFRSYTVEPIFCSFSESRQDFFEPAGRVAKCSPLAPLNPVLLSGHKTECEGVGVSREEFPDGSELSLDYRLDAADMSPRYGVVAGKVPCGSEWLIFIRDEISIPSDWTDEDIVRWGDSQLKLPGRDKSQRQS